MLDVVQDPTWCLHDVHVHMFLQIVVDHWSDYWGIRRFTLPEPSYSMSPKYGHIYARTKRLKDFELRQGEMVPVHILSSVTEESDEEGMGERRLYAAVLRKTILDWAGMQCSPFRAEKRMALNCYWWLMGFKILMPAKHTRADAFRIRRGQGKSYRFDKSDNPFEALGIEVEDLWTGETLRGDYFPWREPDALARECIDLMSFETSTTALDLDTETVRKAVHLVSPLKTDEESS